MKIGMLWADFDKISVEQKIEKAAKYYLMKYNKVASLCFVHPSMITGTCSVGEIEVRPSQSVLPNHFWIGVK